MTDAPRKETEQPEKSGSPQDRIDALELVVADQVRQLARAKKVRETLMDRVERSLDVGGSAAYALFERNTLLQRHVDERTRLLAETNKRLRSQVAQRLEAEEAAVRANRVRGEFLANMSHEIRTPMNGVIGMCELTLRTTLEDNQRAYLDTALGSARSLLRLLDDILDLSKMEAGKVAMRRETFSLRAVLVQALRSVAVQAHTRGLELTYDVTDGLHDGLIGDPGRLQQVLLNLLGNAIKFTDEGGVHLRVREVSATEGSDDVRLVVAVQDTGVGVPADMLSAILESFVQADGSSTRERGGTGLGLAISSHLVDMMEGTLSVDSEVGVGSTFTFEAQFGRGDVAGLPAPQATLSGLQSALRLPDTDGQHSLAHHSASQHSSSQHSSRQHRSTQGTSSQHGSGQPDSAQSRPTQRNSTQRNSTQRNSTQRNSTQRNSTKLGSLESNPGPSSPPPPQAIQSATDVAPLHILLAEDQPINQQVARSLLAELGHDVSVASDGVEAVAMMEGGRFDLVFMDLQMPRLDGLEATQQIRALPREQGADIPIIAMTAHAMAGDQERCIEAGMDDYLAKPVSFAQLSATLDRWSSAVSERRNPPSSAGLAAADLPDLERDATLVALGGDSVLLDDIVALFVTQAADADTDLPLLIQGGDFEAARHLSHSLKGAAGVVGALRCQAAFAGLEGPLFADQAPSRQALATLKAAVKSLRATHASATRASATAT